MNILIVEDELHAARQLSDIIRQCRPDYHIDAILESVEGTVRYFQDSHLPDLLFLDIHLSDGQSFEIFDAVEISTPVIFTTAWDEYAIRAFDCNSVDYLLKPVNAERMEKALVKYEKHWRGHQPVPAAQILQELKQMLLPVRTYRENFLVPFRDQLLPVPVKDFAWFELRNGRVTGTKFDKTLLVLEERSVDDLMQQVDPRYFYRANRQFLVNRNAVRSVAQHFKGKLMAHLHPHSQEPVIISREKAQDFRKWISC
ncbi:MAG TPA: LytTR family DNA-binding domain-containing protein [Pseudobacter sp.]|nr:LytTR family DNA-binding domain-containing protein [Pseudobacter sp.]